MHDVLCGNGVEAVHHHAGRQNVAENFLRPVKVGLRTGAVDAPGGLADLVPVVLQVADKVFKMMPDSVLAGSERTLDCMAEGGEARVPVHREIVRDDPVVVEQRQIEEIAVERRFERAALLALAAQPLRDHLLLEGVQLHMHNRALAPEIVMPLPQLHAREVLLAVCGFELLPRDFPEDLPVLLQNHGHTAPLSL